MNKRKSIVMLVIMASMLLVSSDTFTHGGGNSGGGHSGGGTRSSNTGRGNVNRGGGNREYRGERGGRDRYYGGGYGYDGYDDGIYALPLLEEEAVIAAETAPYYD